MSELAEKMETPAVINQGDALLSMIEKIASNPDADVAKLEKMLDMQERIFNRNAEMAFNQAMATAQSNMGRVSADAENSQTRSRYATYQALDKALRPVYSANGFALSFGTSEAKEGYVRVTCEVSHKDGHSKQYQADMPADGLGAKGNAVMTKTHAAGSAMSYGMRYLLKLIFNVAVGEGDDDGNGANVERITDEQAATLEALVEEVGANRLAFLKHFGARTMDALRASQYNDCVAALNKKRAQ